MTNLNNISLYSFFILFIYIHSWWWLLTQKTTEITHVLLVLTLSRHEYNINNYRLQLTFYLAIKLTLENWHLIPVKHHAGKCVINVRLSALKDPIQCWHVIICIQINLCCYMSCHDVAVELGNIAAPYLHNVYPYFSSLNDINLSPEESIAFYSTPLS